LAGIFLLPLLSVGLFARDDGPAQPSGVAAAFQSPASESSPAGKRLRQFLDAINSPEEAALFRFIDESQPKTGAAKVKPEERRARLKTLRADKAPFQLLEMLEERPDRAIARLKDRHGEQIGLKVEVETQAPYGIRGL